MSRDDWFTDDYNEGADWIDADRRLQEILCTIAELQEDAEYDGDKAAIYDEIAELEAEAQPLKTFLGVYDEE